MEIGPNLANQDIMDTYMHATDYLFSRNTKESYKSYLITLFSINNFIERTHYYHRPVSSFSTKKIKKEEISAYSHLTNKQACQPQLAMKVFDCKKWVR